MKVDQYFIEYINWTVNSLVELSEIYQSFMQDNELNSNPVFLKIFDFNLENLLNLSLD